MRNQIACGSTAIAALTLFFVTPSLAGQSTWLNVSPLKSPSPRRDHMMAYDSNRGVVVMFGGQSRTARMSDTWEWDGYLWNQKTPSTAPPARSAGAMVYDEKRKKIVLFGGAGQTTFADTWEWDGAVWSRKSPTNNPTGRYSHAMSYDSHREVVVMFGGSPNKFDTWEWNGSTWTDMKLASTASPIARSSHALAYDAARKRTVLFGGRYSTNQTLYDTWQWDGKAWTKRSPTLWPRAPWDMTMSYDSDRQRVVCFGGRFYSSDGTNATYEWDGGEWSATRQRTNPPIRYGHGMAYDSKRRRLIVFGGGSSAPYFVGDTWELVHDCILVGEGHPGGGLPITCLTPPLLGTNFRVAFTSSGSGSLFLGVAPVSTPWATFPPPIVCRPGTIHAAPLVTIPGTGKPVILNFSIPNDPRLLGSRVTLQGASPQITGCFLLTDAIEVTIRDR